MINSICLDEKYSTTRLLCKIVDDECLMLNEDGRIKEECKWNINNLELNIKNSKLIGNPDDKFETVLFLPVGEGRKGEGGLRTKGYFKKSYENKPLISIITVVFNGEKYLEETIQSVINQTYDNVEYIIIDGGSTDGTLDIIKKYEDRIDYWVSERDKGIYDAMNKGISLAIGDIIGLINADDWYSDEVFEIIAKNYNVNRLIYGNLLTHFDSGKKYLHSIDVPVSKESLRLSTVHPTVFVAKELYKKVGLFDLAYKLTSDYDMMIRIFLHGAEIVKIDKVLAHFREGGASSNGAGALEGIEIAKKHKFASRVILRKKVNYIILQIKNLIKKKLPFIVHLKRSFINIRFKGEKA